MKTHQIPFDSDRHLSLVERIREYVNFADGRLSSFAERCKNNEVRFDAAVTPDVAGEPRTENGAQPKDDNGNMVYKTLYIPHGYANCLAYWTYLCTVFMSRSPILQVEGRNPAAELNETSLETYLEYQISSPAVQNKAALFTALLDCLRYPIGVIGIEWDVINNWIGSIEEIADPVTGKVETNFVGEEQLEYEGNRIFNVKPVDFGWDPRLGAYEFQKGEFTYVFTTIGQDFLDRGFAEDRFIRGNKEKIELLRSGTKDGFKGFRERNYSAAHRDIPARETDSSATSVGGAEFHYELCEFYWKLNPKQWGLGNIDRTILYAFGVINGEVLLYARPLGARHNKFPFEVFATEPDSYSRTNISLLERVGPFEDVISWLFNSHMYNVRNHLNNNMIVKPEAFVMRDLLYRNPSGIIRMKPNWPGGIAEAYGQLQNTDITRSNLQDIRSTTEYCQQVTGISDNLMGMVHPGGRKTAEEIRTSSSFGTNRIKVHAEFISATAFSPLTSKMISNSQQYLREETSIAMQLPSNFGQPSGNLSGFVNITPTSIAGQYDYSPVDGTMPIDRMSQATILQNLLTSIVQNPQMSAQYNVADIFSFLANLMGIRGMDSFKIQPIPQGQFDQQVQDGSLVPAQQMQGGPPQQQGMPQEGIPPEMMQQMMQQMQGGMG